MVKQTVKAVVVLTTSVVAIPYTVAVLANMLYGWPRGKDKYKRALHPRKVYALNYVVLQEIAKVRYIGLALQWKYFYHNADQDRLSKDLPYGTNGNSMDVYQPQNASGEPLSGNKPVVMFVYGGSWGSGDKNMYGLLCSQLADKLQAVVCCPNYSTYPKGYVDDMVQDLVDCLAWIQDHIQDFGGDKRKVIMIGHSAGAHLCVMSVLELTLKKLLHHPEAVLLSLSGPPSLAVSRQSSLFSDNFRFEDKHFNGSNASNASSNNGDADPNLTSASTTGSFYVVNDKDEKSFVVLNKENGGDSNSKSKVSGDSETPLRNSENPENKDSPQVTFQMSESGDGACVGEREEVLQVEVIEGGDASLPPQITVQDDVDADLTQSQREAMDILSSVRLVVGLAGVYHIADHYDHEAWRGIEDISSMAKAMYGPDHFDRLSPSLLVAELPEKIKLPPMLLVHGDKDKTVPMTSSLRLGQALWEKGCYNVSVSVIPDCSHTDICLDLMDSRRQWYDSVMNEIMKAAQKCL